MRFIILAGVAGLEPATPGFGDQCSSQLSYTPLCIVNQKSVFFVRYSTSRPGDKAIRWLSL